MPNNKNEGSQVGEFVRNAVIPSGMSVKEAADRLGISRPALSNFLNGKVGLSIQMAVRLEKAFGADRQQLLDLQATQDGLERDHKNREVTVRAFVPTFLTIKARQIAHWAENDLDARARLAVLLRKLIHSTADGLEAIDFPGYDNAQRPGPDGITRASGATPWVPEGTAYWEFGTDQRPQAKAERDYRQRVQSIAPMERASATFIFVTPRNWNSKAVWEAARNAEGNWKAVRVFDASDLEQWLEQSVPAQVWLAEQLALPTHGVETLDQAWDRWANAATPALSPEIFATAITEHRDAFRKWIEEPADRPYAIAADSKVEALAFLSCLLDESDLRSFRDRVAIFSDPATLRTLTASSIPIVPIACTEDVERELAETKGRFHCIVLRPRHSAISKSDITLGVLSGESFRRAIATMGIDENEAERLARESGRSPTILRRRLSGSAAINTPQWASDHTNSRSLISIALVGAWSVESEADRKLVGYVSNAEYDAIESELARFLQFDDSPVFSVGKARGVVSKIDVLFAIAPAITQADLDRFFVAAKTALAESDPALELPEDQRWMANVFGKRREHSGTLRKQISETLVILAVHGNSLFQQRLGLNIEGRVDSFVRELLTPLTLGRLQSSDGILPQLAEAAPEVFLQILKDDLNCADPTILGLLQPVDRNSFGVSPYRTGILWALETLAWNPKRLLHVVSILAHLAEVEIDDNWANRPDASLQSLFRSWMPQTAASIEQRIKALDWLFEKHPDIGWQVALAQVQRHQRFGHRNSRPQWRSDAGSAGEVVSEHERILFCRHSLNLLLSRTPHDLGTLKDLVESLQALPEIDQMKVWELVDSWAANADQPAKAELRECIRLNALTRLAKKRKMSASSRAAAQKAYDRLQPEDPVARHMWLFREHWVQESADEIDAAEIDYDQREQRIDTLRREALREIWEAHEFEGIHLLLADSDAAGIVGRYAAASVPDARRGGFIKYFLSISDNLQNKTLWCLQGFLAAIGESSLVETLQAVMEEFSIDQQVRLFTCAPFRQVTWDVLDRYGDAVRDGYWKTVHPYWARPQASELAIIVDRLLAARRPRAAFNVAHLGVKELETSRLKRLLYDLATIDDEGEGIYKIGSHYIAEALDVLEGREGISSDDMAPLELMFIRALDHGTRGIPNIERLVADSPAMFSQAIALAFIRTDGGEDPPEHVIEDQTQRDIAASNAYHLLDRIRRIPGTDVSGQIDTNALVSWILEVRQRCKDLGRLDIADQRIGQLLSHSPAETTGLWPCIPVCQAIEQIGSRDLGEGFRVGAYNSRGVHWRQHGGEQERALAKRYRGWSEEVLFEFPFVSSVLEDIAKGYDREASREDLEAEVSRRLFH